MHRLRNDEQYSEEIRCGSYFSNRNTHCAIVVSITARYNMTLMASVVILELFDYIRRIYQHGSLCFSEHQGNLQWSVMHVCRPDVDLCISAAYWHNSITNVRQTSLLTGAISEIVLLQTHHLAISKEPLVNRHKADIYPKPEIRTGSASRYCLFW